MSETDLPAPNNPPSPADAAVSVLGVTAQAVVGETNSTPQSDAAPAADQPATSGQEPGGPAPADPGASATTPGATEREVLANLNAIEQLALFWGGETGTKIRNHVGRVRELLGG